LRRYGEEGDPGRVASDVPVMFDDRRCLLVDCIASSRLRNEPNLVEQLS
jgi:hypothetical protein